MALATVTLLAVNPLSQAKAASGVTSGEVQSTTIKSQVIDKESLTVEFRGGTKLSGTVPAVTAEEAGITATASVYVAIDAGHGKGYGSECPNGCYTGAQPAAGYVEDEMNRKVAIQLYNKLDAAPSFFPAVSRWVSNNDREAADWDWYTSSYPLESGQYAGDHMFLDSIPYTTKPDTSWALNGCATCKDNKKASIYDRPAHANGLSVGDASHGKIMVSLHFDMGSRDGPLVYVQDPTIGSSTGQKDHSVALATAICNKLYTLRFGGTPDCSTRVLTGNYAVLRELFNDLPNGHGFPAVLVEIANLNSTADRTWLGTGTNQNNRMNEFGTAIYDGIVDWHNANN
jgi:N-acetylmuramoyl-L-alanine amidase